MCGVALYCFATEYKLFSKWRKRRALFVDVPRLNFNVVSIKADGLFFRGRNILGNKWYAVQKRILCYKDDF